MNVISQTSFTLQQGDVQRIMLAQRDASDAVVQSQTGVWRKLRIASIAGVPLLALVAAGIKTSPGMQISFTLMLLLGLLFYVSNWRIKQRMYEMGASNTVSRKSVIKAVENNIFKGQAQLACEARFDEQGFELLQNGLRLAAAYDDESRIGIIFERQGMLQITSADTRGMPDAVFFIPLQQLPDAEAVMQRLQCSPCFVSAR
ncbi:MAG: hypothetical protein LBJ15_23200 [Comamonas sp.]|jgi:hypothetical protein|uniref:hypothetical protein n=1 Tax=Comamonas sp. TaxID=34028 RepID=UPI00282E2EC5|nr:hypothetical protein [Comamonas sp.]MDR0216894.1 hypothetical protein [Comamonas sp.]MDR2299312.1 hypothetical protein [Comamonas sp.]